MANHDTVAVVPRYEEDVKIVASHFWEQVGGPVPVALMAVARLGGFAIEIVTHSCAKDTTGDSLRTWLGEDGVTTSHCPRPEDAATSRALVLIESATGGRFVASYGGDPPPITFTPEHEAVFRTASALHLDGRDLPAARQAAQWTRAEGGIVSFDLGTMRPGRETLLPLCDIVLASQIGGAGTFPDVADNPGAQVRRFLEQGAQIAGVTLGSRGLVIGEKGSEPYHLPAFTIGDVRDTCGAGDCFHGAFLWAHLSGYPLRDAAQFAQAAVAHRIRHFGNRAGLPRRADVESVVSS